jgi:hypothetical protein
MLAELAQANFPRPSLHRACQRGLEAVSVGNHPGALQGRLAFVLPVGSLSLAQLFSKAASSSGSAVAACAGVGEIRHHRLRPLRRRLGIFLSAIARLGILCRGRIAHD